VERFQTDDSHFFLSRKKHQTLPKQPSKYTMARLSTVLTATLSLIVASLTNAFVAPSAGLASRSCLGGLCMSAVEEAVTGEKLDIR